MTWSNARKRDYPTLSDRPEKFWAKVAIGSTDECWEWNGCRASTGYGRAGKHDYAHRLAYIITHGPIPDGMFVLHRCDNPPCVNPAHLFLGTPGDNARDMAQKGRVRGGLKPGRVPMWTPSQKAHAAGTCMRGHSREHTVFRKSGARAGGVAYCRLCAAE